MTTERPNVFTYPRNEPGTTGHLDLVEPLRALPGELRAALEGISEEVATFRPAPDEWCIHEIAGHLRDAAEVYHKRLYMMSTQTDPILEVFDESASARERLKKPLQQILAELEEHRGRTVRLLTTLVNWNWARTGQHVVRGRMSIRQTVEHMVEHDAGHLAGIRELRRTAEAAG